MNQSRWIWVTGASTGIGEALARRLLQDGHRVVISARSADKLDALARAFPEQCHTLPVDLTDREALSQAADRLKAITPHLDAVVINAGTCEYIDVKHFDAAPFAPVMNINVIGSANTVEVALPFLRRSPNRAQVVGVGSMVTVLPLTRSEAYGASKAAMEYFMHSLRVDLAPEGIDVTLVRPGFVKTPLTDRNDFEMPFLVEAETAAEHIARGMARRQRIVQFPWQLVWTMRLISWLPLGWKTALLKKMVKA
ncbi:SDR family NAD(P)-dependent oxidoreductase [Marinimicrobium sp. C6131]|uniref:SDR family NAD(P)-dependent oxidoreductase n=1 Tax=Marinimicrobium sp. C6131 TaxID=3022676 RepID=UPI00223E49C8|nr:SDR family NAD(P)-dependent oxidoreductase [Marinimicrobium sp. C6131]UZJ45385.1 SDR family NAD(P)-dependent oxidoreductase [Marinimicrobium sp. C6131]